MLTCVLNKMSFWPCTHGKTRSMARSGFIFVQSISQWALLLSGGTIIKKGKMLALKTSRNFNLQYWTKYSSKWKLRMPWCVFYGCFAFLFKKIYFLTHGAGQIEAKSLVHAINVVPKAENLIFLSEEIFHRVCYWRGRVYTVLTHQDIKRQTMARHMYIAFGEAANIIHLL